MFNIFFKHRFLTGPLVFFLFISPKIITASEKYIPIDSWTFECQRPEIAPKYWVEKDIQFQDKKTLALSGKGREYANGYWTTTVSTVPGKPYTFMAHYLAENILEENRSVLARIHWRDSNGERVGRAEFPRTIDDKNTGDWKIIKQQYPAPDKAVQAKIELIYRWAPHGKLYWGGISFQQIDKIEQRLVNIATIHLRPKGSKTPMENLGKFAEYLTKAGQKGADIVCLPEGITLVGTGKKYVDVCEPVPGPSTKFLGEIAKQHSMYIVAGIYEKEKDVIYNTSVLLDRQGKLSGKYRKVCLPREEIKGGITPGNAFPVFDTDFGRIGMMICWDVYFPEPARALSQKGAEIILLPIWGGNLTLARARAIENQIYLVSSTYDMKTGIFDQEGELMAEGTETNPIAMVKIDLNKQKLWPCPGSVIF
jgi:predicted amidohydrolase